jgi:predicted Fe-Mo cluster-binding NifX family protein
MDYAPIIAVTSQNHRTVTGHAGRCRRFKLFDPATGEETGGFELPLEGVLHEVDPLPGHPLAQAGTLITGGAGPGLRQRLAQFGINVYLTTTVSPEEAVREYIAGKPSAVGATSSCDHTHGHDHHHHDHEEECD